MNDSFLKIVRSKSKKEWRQIIDKLLGLVRELLQKNGEVSALVGLTAGVVLVLLFQWVVFLSVVAGLILWILYMFAPEE